MKFKVGDKVRRSQESIDGGNYCDDCAPNKIAVICEIIGGDGSNWKARCPNGAIEYFPESSIELVKSNYKPKNPTHLVVWEVEGCGDPCKFFTNEKDAKEEVKTLSELSGVKKNSIILVEIKSAQKVNVIKNVRLNQYKI